MLYSVFKWVVKCLKLWSVLQDQNGRPGHACVHHGDHEVLELFSLHRSTLIYTLVKSCLEPRRILGRYGSTTPYPEIDRQVWSGNGGHSDLEKFGSSVADQVPQLKFILKVEKDYLGRYPKSITGYPIIITSFKFIIDLRRSAERYLRHIQDTL